MKFKFLPHTADRKFQAFGKTLEEVFKNSALALFNIIYDKKISENKKFKISVKGKDLESLMYNFLEEFLVLIDSKNFLPSKITNLKFDTLKNTPRRGMKIQNRKFCIKGINKKNFKIKAEVVGDDAKNYNISEHVKAITYNEMFVKKEKGRWIAQVVLDI